MDIVYTSAIYSIHKGMINGGKQSLIEKFSSLKLNKNGINIVDLVLNSTVLNSTVYSLTSSYRLNQQRRHLVYSLFILVRNDSFVNTRTCFY